MTDNQPHVFCCSRGDLAAHDTPAPRAVNRAADCTARQQQERKRRTELLARQTPSFAARQFPKAACVRAINLAGVAGERALDPPSNHARSRSCAARVAGVQRAGDRSATREARRRTLTTSNVGVALTYLAR